MAKPDFKKMMETGAGLSGFEWPESCGTFDFVIKKDGTWFYQGTPVGRIKLCQLFAITLQKDDEGYWLVTPVERGKIEVEDAPFFVVEMDVEGTGDNQALTFRTTLDWWITAGAENKIWVEFDENGQPSPYIYIRDGLHARINRNVFYELCNMADVVVDELIIQSNGVKFSLGKITDE
ncbi:MAG: DUF1285 domain-containing protein [Alphaproteobacteria bacterium]